MNQSIDWASRWSDDKDEHGLAIWKLMSPWTDECDPLFVIVDRVKRRVRQRRGMRFRVRFQEHEQAIGYTETLGEARVMAEKWCQEELEHIEASGDCSEGDE